RTGKATVCDMGFEPIELEPRRSSPLTSGAVASVGLRWRGRIVKSFEMTVHAGADVAVKAVAKKTVDEGQVFFSEREPSGDKATK
ncbi:MAG: hypothetical protein AAFQ82_17475, partial [Myxococcota bacterium]